MRRFIKILLILLAITPMWLTIIALADEPNWKDRINQKLLEIEDRKIQVVELFPSSDAPAKEDLKREFDLEITQIQPRGASDLTLKFFDENGLLQKRSKIRAKLDVQKKVPVTRYPLSRGHNITSADFTIEWKDVTSYRGIVPSTVEGRRARTTIRSGEIITENDLQKDLLVRKGERIHIRVKGDGLSLTMVGVAEESGISGQTIRILNTDSKKTVYATIVGKRTAEVQL